MLRMETIENTINEYYDEELSKGELLNYEARLAISKGIRDFTNKRCFEYFKITNSIKMSKIRSKKIAEKIVDKFLEENQEKLFNTNPVGFKGFYKRICNLFLNMLRNNS